MCTISTTLTRPLIYFFSIFSSHSTHWSYRIIISVGPELCFVLLSTAHSPYSDRNIIGNTTIFIKSSHIFISNIILKTASFLYCRSYKYWNLLTSHITLFPIFITSCLAPSIFQLFLPKTIHDCLCFTLTNIQFFPFPLSVVLRNLLVTWFTP